MSLILGYRYSLSSLAINWQDTKRKVGMNDILWITTRYPSRREVDSIRLALTDNECCIIFDGNDRAQYIYRADNF